MGIDQYAIKPSSVPTAEHDPAAIRVLLSAYACAPQRGSEVGVGWNWVINLARYCRLTVITEAEFQTEITDAIRRRPPAFVPEFHFIDIGNNARRRCWNQGDWRFYADYRRWQWRAYQLATNLAQSQSYDVCHHLGMIGYREPGYLWQLPLPFIWGPIGGHVQMPVGYLGALGLRGGIFHVCRNIANAIQMRSLKRVRCAAQKAAVIIASTPVDQTAINTIHHKAALLMPESGTDESDGQSSQCPRPFTGTLTLVWCGKFVARKALPIALHAVKVALENGEHLHLHVIGTGPEQQKWHALADRLGISLACQWHGQVEHEQALTIISNSDAMVLTSLQEANTTVVMEALARGVPVICHDTCGAVIDARCGLKILPHTFAESVAGFADAILSLWRQPGQLQDLSRGARVRSQDLTWRRKAEVVSALYRQVSRKNAQAGELTRL